MKKIAALIMPFLVLSCTKQSAWLYPDAQFRLPIIVNTGAVDRFDKPIEIDVPLADIRQHTRDEIDLSAHTLQLVQVNKRGREQYNVTPMQFHVDSSLHVGRLTFIMPGFTQKNKENRFHLYMGETTFYSEPDVQTPVAVQCNIMHEEQESFEIKTPVATFYYHRFGAGFASMDDRDGNDWLSYNPGVGQESQSGSGGMYRGLPNMGYPEGYCHPGKEVSDSRIIESGPIKVSILSESNDQKMQCVWDIFPAFARLTIIKLRTPYWFLYEGTPGGKLEEESDFCVRPGNIKTLCSEKWDGDIDAHNEPGEWLYFSDASSNRSIFLVQHLDDEHDDSYWPMNKEMTVFGFGRLNMTKSMHRQNNQFTIGLAETHDYDEMKKIIDSAYQPVTVTVGAIQARL